MIMLVTSRKNSAGMSIAKKCEKLGMKVHYCEEEILEINKLPDAEPQRLATRSGEISTTAYIFLSTHRSESKMPCFTSHFPGIFGDDVSHGGNPKELAYSYPGLQKIYMRALSSIKGEWKRPELEKYQVVVEATHHGPTHFKKPVLFVEIGSSEAEWDDESAAELVAEAVKRTISRIKNETFIKTAIAFGGTHYPEKFTEVIIKGEYSIGHILPKYQNENMSEEMFEQMVSKSIEPVKYVLIDWKGINKKSTITDWAKNKGLEVVKI